MEKQNTRKTYLTNFWFVFITPFLLIMLLIISNYYSTFNNNLSNSFIVKHLQYTYSSFNQIITSQKSVDCTGKYIYIHELPPRLNFDLLENCHSLLVWSDMCSSVSNAGFGPAFDTEETNDMTDDYKRGSWFQTNQFMLGVIFHNRMMKYKCLTRNSSLASAFYVPFYAGLEVGRNLWGVNATTRDSLSLELTKILREKQEWNKMMGRDHFLISGRISGDLRRMGDNDSDWGNKLMFLPEMKNMTMLAIEATMWKNDAAIPYPTYFHPKTEEEVLSWQSVVSSDERKHLFSFAGAPRPTIKESIRSEIIKQCEESSSGDACALLSCKSTSKKNCENPVHVINFFRSSVFCLQPAGDSYTRRSFFDSILAGCIPVVFHEKTAYKQYLWHLPKNHTKYSVLIPENDVRNGKVKIRDVLQRFINDEIVEMRKEVIKLIPRVIYSNGGLGTIEDAFDIAVDGMLERVERTRKDILEGRNSELEFGEKDDWK